MSEVGTVERPLRVAIIGSGPTGFYAAEHLFKRDLVVEIDMFDRLPTPFGLVRGGVAPDHQKIKSVTKAFDRTAQRPNFRFYGNVEMGRDLHLEDLRAHYHQIVYCTGAQTDRSLGIPGEDLAGSHAATEFVAWYNGHPDYQDYEFDLSQESVAVIGVGNVAVDVCRILSRTPEELAKTDIADQALEALRKSNVKNVYMIGRRGPAQAAFTSPEVKELGELDDADVIVLPEEAELDLLSHKMLQANQDRSIRKKIEILQGYAEQEELTKPRQLTIRFLVSPTEIIGENGRVTGIKLVKNELYKTEDGSLRPRPTEAYEEIPVGLVFRSVGYRGVSLPGVPFHDRWGVILNEDGRVLDPEQNTPVVGEYTAGWVKRGPSGVIGTNKPDALETVQCMIDDVENGVHLNPAHPQIEAAEALIRERQPKFVSYDDWLHLNEMEVAKGEETGRPRVKFTRVEEMLQALGK